MVLIYQKYETDKTLTVDTDL